jgi:ABC-type sulfate transport system substrate-binding protein
MARATEQDMRDFLGDTGQVPSARLSLLLETARQTVVRDGIPENHESFASLHMLFTAHLLDSGGAIGGSLASRSVGDVSVSFASEGESYKSLYQTLKTQIVGLSGRIA